MEGGSGVAVPQRPKVPAGISNIGNEPQAPAPSRPITPPVGAGPLVSAGTLQFGEAASPATPSAQQTGTSSAVAAAKVIVEEALKKPDYLKALSEAYTKASPELRQLMLNNADVRAVISEAAKTATAVLTNENKALRDNSTGGSMNPQARADSAIKSLDEMVQRLDSAFAGAVADEAMGAFKQFHGSHRTQDCFGPQGITALVWLSGRIAGTPQGDHAVAGFVTLNAWDGAAVGEAIAGGAGDAYAIAYAGYVKNTDG